MNFKLTGTISFVLLMLFHTPSTAQAPVEIFSPDKNVRVRCWLNGAGQPFYKIVYKEREVILESKLGLITQNGSVAEYIDFSTGLVMNHSRRQKRTKEKYQLYTGKKNKVQYRANQRILHFQKSAQEKLDIIFRVSNDGVAFRYHFPQPSKLRKKITEEQTTFHFNTSTRAFLQPMQVAKTGWEQTNPAYEEHYRQNIPVSTPSTLGAGWVYPALFQHGDVWVLLTEAGLEGDYCGTRLQHGSPNGEYRVGFPDPREVVTGGGLLPETNDSPWRIITMGSLKTITESTLGTDLARPVDKKWDWSFVKPGKASWSWIMSKDDSIVYSEQVRYIDMASKMNWQYCLVDAAWDRKIGYEKIRELSKYAASKNVGLLLWYNSAGDWNTVKYTPKGKLLTPEDREKEFSLLNEMGIKGVKIDFFAGDGQSVIQYYQDILKDAARHKLLVNFHGATLPRGWHRTWPNLLTTEAVRGFEMVTFTQQDADAQANHCAVLPFTRNAFDPMDFTPMNLYKIPTRVKRKTTSGFELATSVLFLSGIQHFAESPAGMEQVPDYVQQFLRTLPDRWDDVKYIDGYPGKYAVIARRSGKKWYVAGINGEKDDRTLPIDLTPFKKANATLITDGEEPLTFTTQTSKAASIKNLHMKANGGFVLVLE
jgi:hypothetical protein